MNRTTVVSEGSGRRPRRTFLRNASAFLGAAAVEWPRFKLPLHAARSEQPPLKVWWWGEQEAIGIRAWMNDTYTQFYDRSGLAVDALLLETDEVVERFTTAAVAGEVPDVQFLWNGIYHMENVWSGHLAPLDGLVSRRVLRRSGATRLSVFESKQYRVGFYAIGFGISYNKNLFDRAGLNPDSPPRTWDAFLDACDKLRSSGTTPIAGGARDGYFGDWFLNHGLVQQLDSPADALDLFIGNRDWRDPKYYAHWVKMEELHKQGFFNSEINSLDLYQGIDLFHTARAAMSLNASPALAYAQQQLGREQVGFMVMPVFGTGKLAGLPLLDTQGFGIPSRAGNPGDAARLLEFMHGKERLQAMWTLSHQIPADEAFDSSVIEDPLIRRVFDTWVAGPNAVYVGILMPLVFWTNAMFVAARKILAGEFSGEQAGELAYAVTDEWRTAFPDRVNSYTKWVKTLEL